MFEDSTFESTGMIRTRSRRWMLVTFALNASVLLALILIPLIYPEAIPSISTIMLLEAPTAPPEEPKPQSIPHNAVVVERQFDVELPLNDDSIMRNGLRLRPSGGAVGASRSMMVEMLGMAWATRGMRMSASRTDAFSAKVTSIHLRLRVRIIPVDSNVESSNMVCLPMRDMSGTIGSAEVCERDIA